MTHADPAVLTKARAQVDSAPGPRLSDILVSIAEKPTEPGERIFLGELVDGFGNRAFGALLLIFALPVAFPIAIPGISGILGAPLVFLSWQLMLGHNQPWLPRALRNRSFDRQGFARFLHRAIPWMRRLEHLFAPRLSWLVTHRAERVVGLVALLFASVLFLPIPFGNTVPGIAIVVLALALIERDGLAGLIGTSIGLAGIALVSGVIIGLGVAAADLLQTHFAL